MPVRPDPDCSSSQVDQERIRRAVREILLAIGEDPDREGLQETPDRVARMYAELFRGLRQDRSEEHTSELQSLRQLVCRLLLEKKKAASHRCTSAQTTRTDSNSRT